MIFGIENLLLYLVLYGIMFAPKHKSVLEQRRILAILVTVELIREKIRSSIFMSSNGKSCLNGILEPVSEPINVVSSTFQSAVEYLNTCVIILQRHDVLTE